MENGPRPLPLQSGFNSETAYRALGCYNPSETSDAYYILSNDRDEIWFICNRHLRTVCLSGESIEFRRPLVSEQQLLGKMTDADIRIQHS